MDYQIVGFKLRVNGQVAYDIDALDLKMAYRKTEEFFGNRGIALQYCEETRFNAGMVYLEEGFGTWRQKDEMVLKLAKYGIRSVHVVPDGENGLLFKFKVCGVTVDTLVVRMYH